MTDNPFLYDLPTSKKTTGRWLIDILQVVVITIALLIIAYLFLVIPNQVDGSSMLPNCHDKELLFTNKMSQVIGDKDFMAK